MTRSSNGARPRARTLVAAAAGGTVAARHPPPAPAPPSRSERRYRLRDGETVAAGIRRVARGQVADSSDALARAADREELGEAVHSTRKAIKRVRTTLRLSRDAIGESAYRRETARLKAIAAGLAGVRDAQVLMETLAKLEEGAGGARWVAATERLQARLRDEHDRAATRLAGDGDAAVAARQALEDARARTTAWTFAREDFGAVQPGLRRIYRQGRRRMRAAQADPTAENLHHARKRVKDLWHATQLLRPAAPKRMKRFAREAHELADLLGDHHDLSVLRAYVEQHPQTIADTASRDALLAALDERRDEVARRALKLGRRVYRRTPRRFVKAVGRGWRKRVGEPQQAGAR